MNKYPIYIPSKNRASILTTVTLLNEANLDYHIVVEPQDFNKYKDEYTSVVVLPENSMGLGYARNFIKKHSEENGDTYHWQLDDDIKKIKRRVNGKNVLIDIKTAINEIEQYVDEFSNVAIAGLNDAVYAWTKKEPLAYNKQVSTFCLFKNHTGISWDDNVIEDTDYSLQTLISNYVTVLFNWLCYEKHPNMKLKGGLQSEDIIPYNSLKVALSKKYPDIFKVKIKDGKISIAPSRIWSKFKQRPA
jgi:hypothetical protein